MKQKAREIRATCLGTEEIGKIMTGIWRFAVGQDWKQAEVRQKVREQLEMYEDSREAILEHLKASRLPMIQELEEVEERTFWFNSAGKY
jgi:hypothetical protein